MPTWLHVLLFLPAAAAAHPGHGESSAFHWHGAELLLVVLALAGLAWFFGRR
jgi:hypothetical protein